jgi:urease accessory protein
VKATATVVAEGGRCTTLRSSPPFALRETPDGLHLVGSAAGPVGGDELAIDVAVVGDLTVRTVAAQLVFPGPHGTPSSLTLRATVDGSLRWLPGPTVLVAGCDHHTTTVIDLTAGSSLVWSEVVVLGRHDEPSGSVQQRLRVDRDGRPLVRTDVRLGPGHEAGVGGARVVGTALVVGRPVAALPAGVRGAIHPLAEDAFLVSVLADAVEPILSLHEEVLT